MKIFNATQQVVLAQKARIADTFSSRLIGLLKKSALLPGEALVLPHCQSIHMFFMRFNIDVIFVDKNNKIVGLVERIKPFRLSPFFLKAKYAVELPEGTIALTQASLGHQVLLID